MRLLKWLKTAGFRVVLIVPAEHVDNAALCELRKVVFDLQLTRPAWRTQLGARFPRARRALWEPLKLGALSIVQLADVGERFAESETEPRKKAQLGQRYLGEQNVKEWFAPPRLIELVGKLARKYKPSAVIVEYIFSSPVFGVLPPGTLRLIDTINVFSRKEEQVLAYGIADPLACSEGEEREYLMTADVLIAIQSREAQLLKEIAPEREVILAGIDLDVVPKISGRFGRSASQWWIRQPIERARPFVIPRRVLAHNQAWLPRSDASRSRQGGRHV